MYLIDLTPGDEHYTLHCALINTILKTFSQFYNFTIIKYSEDWNK